MRGAVAVILLGAAVRAHALAPIDTDGPDFVESAEVVEQGRFQYEMDLIRLQDHERHRLASSSALLRFGAFRDVELRLDLDASLENGRTTPTAIAAGLKWHARDHMSEGGAPAIAFIVDTEFPRAGGERSSTSLREVVSWELGACSIGAMPGLTVEAGGLHRRSISGILGLVGSYRVTETLRVFAEFAGTRLATSGNGGTLVQWDLGAARLLTRDTQLGLRMGIGTNRASPRTTFLLEIAQRF